jgi:hypothetical protein
MLRRTPVLVSITDLTAGGTVLAGCCDDDGPKTIDVGGGADIPGGQCLARER